ncbi:Cbb3-type cytochrome oxidase component FixQ [Solitalea koreensis]|uniref:Cbb3-type cytochrome oxidase component FixQ n=1 Tax=Solitalea koreensis TaxID=543615 RepID=A0A521BET8_9SPHI|nr:Cbb3-type cytochrome oxidase component FixQ [Solitalea koreensis]
MNFINYLESITGIGIYPLLSFLIFFIFFILLIVYVFKSNKKLLNEMSNIPLNDNDLSSN